MNEKQEKKGYMYLEPVMVDILFLQVIDRH